jgi:hypothetical protein
VRTIDLAASAVAGMMTKAMLATQLGCENPANVSR